VHLGFYLYIRRYIAELLPSRRIHRYWPTGTTGTRGQILTLVHDDRVVGFTSLEPYGGDTCWVTYFFIDPPYHGKGFGVLLCEALLDHGHYRLGYRRIQGATSSIQKPQIRVQQKFGRLLCERG